MRPEIENMKLKNFISCWRWALFYILCIKFILLTKRMKEQRRLIFVVRHHPSFLLLVDWCSRWCWLGPFERFPFFLHPKRLYMYRVYTQYSVLEEEGSSQRGNNYKCERARLDHCYKSSCVAASYLSAEQWVSRVVFSQLARIIIYGKTL